MFSSLALLTLFQTPAAAASCDAALKRAETAKGADTAAAFGALIKCDRTLAEESFAKVMTNAGDADALVALTLTAIDGEVWTPVWTMVGRIKDYAARDEVATRVGEACVEHGRVVSFLQGAYFGLHDAEFLQWDNALASCESPALMTWMTQQVEGPPDKPYDEKFNTVAAAFAKKKGPAALESLAKGAVKAAKGGPFDALLAQMDEAVAPELGEEMTADNKAALEKALIQVASGAGPAQARMVADRLADGGNQSAAASLLPKVYPDRVQSGGGFLYGGVSIETADCKGVKTAVLHVASVTEPGKLWNILGAVEAPLRVFKPKLEKCKAESADPWPVATTPEPLKDAKALEAWVKALTDQWTAKGYTVQRKDEKAIAL